MRWRAADGARGRARQRPGKVESAGTFRGEKGGTSAAFKPLDSSMRNGTLAVSSAAPFYFSLLYRAEARGARAALPFGVGVGFVCTFARERARVDVL